MKCRGDKKQKEMEDGKKRGEGGGRVANRGQETGERKQDCPRHELLYKNTAEARIQVN